MRVISQRGRRHIVASQGTGGRYRRTRGVTFAGTVARGGPVRGLSVGVGIRWVGILNRVVAFGIYLKRIKQLFGE